MKRRRGVTFVEVLVTLVIVGLAVLPMFTVSSTSEKQTVQAAYLLMAHSHLKKVIENFESSLIASEFTLEEKTIGPTMREVSWSGWKIQVEETLVLSQSEEVPGLWELKGSLFWAERRGTRTKPRRLSLVRLVGNPRVASRGGSDG